MFFNKIYVFIGTLALGVNFASTANAQFLNQLTAGVTNAAARAASVTSDISIHVVGRDNNGSAAGASWTVQNGDGDRASVSADVVGSHGLDFKNVLVSGTTRDHAVVQGNLADTPYGKLDGSIHTDIDGEARIYRDRAGDSNDANLIVGPEGRVRLDVYGTPISGDPKLAVQLGEQIGAGFARTEDGFGALIGARTKYSAVLQVNAGNGGDDYVQARWSDSRLHAVGQSIVGGRNPVATATYYKKIGSGHGYAGATISNYCLEVQNPSSGSASHSGCMGERSGLVLGYTVR